MTLLWVSGCPFILVPFVWVQVWVRVRLGPQPFGYGGGTGEVGLFFPWKKQLASLRHLFSGGKNNPTSPSVTRSEEHTSELQSRPHLVCRLLLEKKKKKTNQR